MRSKTSVSFMELVIEPILDQITHRTCRQWVSAEEILLEYLGTISTAETHVH